MRKLGTMERVVAFLKSQNGERYTPKEIAMHVGVTVSAVTDGIQNDEGRRIDKISFHNGKAGSVHVYKYKSASHYDVLRMPLAATKPVNNVQPIGW